MDWNASGGGCLMTLLGAIGDAGGLKGSETTAAAEAAASDEPLLLAAVGEMTSGAAADAAVEDDEESESTTSAAAAGFGEVAAFEAEEAAGEEAAGDGSAADDERWAATGDAGPFCLMSIACTESDEDETHAPIRALFQYKSPT